MTDLLDPIVQAIPDSTPTPTPTPTLGAGALTESVQRSKHVHVGQQRTFNPDALLEAGVGRAAAGGAVVGLLLFTVFVGLLGTWIGLDDAGSVFLGVFTGFWGGLGFGAMVGALVAVGRDERERAAVGNPSPESP